MLAPLSKCKRKRKVLSDFSPSHFQSKKKRYNLHLRITGEREHPAKIQWPDQLRFITGQEFRMSSLPGIQKFYKYPLHGQKDGLYRKNDLD